MESGDREPTRTRTRSRFLESALLVVVGLVGLIWAVGWETVFSVLPGGLEQSSPEPATAPRPRVLWDDEGIVDPRTAPVSRLRLLAYREGLVAGLTWIHGLTVLPEDTPDRRLSRSWVVRLPQEGGKWSAPVRVQVVLQGQEPDGRFEVQVKGSGPGRTIRTIPPEGAGIPLGGGADLALSDLSAVLDGVGIARPKARGPVDAGPRRPWAPGGLKALHEALSPLEADPSTVSPAALATAARALAWQSLLDHRLAPTLAPLRAAQALALAAVAERLAGGPLPDAQAARWLAPGAAVGDLWLAAATSPPAGFPDLDALHKAIGEPTIPKERPPSWGLPELVAMTERAASLGYTPAFKRFLGWSIGLDSLRTGLVYLANTGEFSTVIRTAGLPIAVPMAELADLGPALGPDLPAAALQEASRWKAGRLYDKLRDPACLSGPIEASRALAGAGVNAPSWVRRIVLDEAADRILHGLCSVAEMYGNYGWTDQIENLGRVLRAHGEWLHPELAWQLNTPGLGKVVGNELLIRATLVLKAAGQSMPGLLHCDTHGSRLSSRVEWEMAQLQLLHFRDHPVQVARTVRYARRWHKNGLITALSNWLARTQGKDRAPLYGPDLRSPKIVINEQEASRAPEPWRSTPHIVTAIARRLGRESSSAPNLAKAGDLLARAFEEDPSSQEVATELVSLCARRGDLGEASRVGRRFVESGPAGLGAASLATSLATILRKRGARQNALEWSMEAAQSQAAWALLNHAENLAIMGAPEEALEFVDETDRHYGKSPAHDFVRAEIQIIGGKGEAGWKRIEELEPKRSADDLRELAANLGEARVAFPKTALGQRMAIRRDLDALLRKADEGPVEVKDVVALLGQGNALDRGDTKVVVKEVRSVLSRLVGRCLADALRASPAPGQKAPGTGVETVLTTLLNAMGSLEPKWDLNGLTILLDWLILYGADEPGRARVVQLMLPRLKTWDRTLVSAITRQARGLDDYLAVYAHELGSTRSVGEYIQFLWMEGRDSDLKSFLDAILPRGGTEIADALGLFPALLLVCGSLDGLQAWLEPRGVSAVAFQKWKAVGGVTWTLRERELVAKYRPDGTVRNLLAP